MEMKIPDELKVQAPQTFWGKVLTATPVVMTVIATLLAGLASSEMTRAQYSRALAAQQQSKTGDQWNFYQAKRLHSALQLSTRDELEAAGEVHPLEPAMAESFAVPAPPAVTRMSAPVRAAAGALQSGRPDSEVVALAAKLEDSELEEALRAAQARADAFSAELHPVDQKIGQIEKESLGRHNRRDFIAARLEYAAQRYEAEARLNQNIAYLYELEVRKSNFTAERHERRSQRFFLGMLAAQAAVIIATLALAAKQRSLLWGLAAAAGLAAVGFAIYVYLFT